MTTLIDYIKGSTGLDENTIAPVIDSMISAIANLVRNGESVKLEGLGTFKIIDKPDREGRNPRTGEPTIFKASRRVKLGFSKNFVDSIQPGFVPEAEAETYLIENPEAIAEMPSAISADLLPQSPYFTSAPAPESVPEPPPIPAELLNQVKSQLELMWQIKAPDDSFVQVPTNDLPGWGVTPTTPIYSPATGWQLAGKIPELAGIVI